jgi:hypothetical protein
VTDVENENLNSLPVEFQLYQNYPNPFNPVTKIKYAVSQRENVVIKIFDLLGREITTLVNEEKLPGNYEVELDANKLKLSSGIYVYQMRAGSFTSSRKLVLIK